MMDPKKLASLLAMASLLSVPVNPEAGEAGAARIHDGSQGAGLGLEGAAEPALAAFDGTLIERTLGKGASETIVVPQGAAVRLVLHAPAGTELHLHGYDLIGTAKSGRPVVMTFRAEHAGRFPIETHGHDHGVLGHRERALVYIEVRPE